MPRRLLALLAAVAMVLIAVTVRDRIDDGDDGGGGGSGALQLLCASELRAVCEAIDGDDGIEVTVEAATLTADRLRGVEPDEAELDGWLAPGPWGEIVDATRGATRAGLFADTGAPLARSPFVIAVWKNKRAALNCADPIDLGCLGDAVIARGFRLGGAGDGQAEGLLADAALAVGHIKNPDFATNDLNETDLAGWLASVDVKVDGVTRNPGGRAFTELLTFGAAAADGFLAPESMVRPQFERAARRGEFDLVQVAPTATADVLFSRRGTDRGARLAEIVRRDRVRDLLRDNGWRVNTAGLPSDDGLPSAGVLQALREVTK